MKHFFPLFLFVSFPLLVAAIQCYYPDGLVPTDYTYVPCVGDGFSSCCIPNEGDVCLSNGLCYYPKGAYPFRGACTDLTWSSDACPKYCISTNPSEWQTLTSCGGGQYCCRLLSDSGGTCCTNSTKVFSVEPGVVINDYGQTGVSVPGTATATPSPSSTSGSTGSSSTSGATPTSTPVPSKNNTKAIAIGVGVGVPLVLIFFALLVFFWYSHVKKRRAAPALAQEQQQQVPYPQQQPYSPQQPYATYPPQQQATYSPAPAPAPPYHPQQGGVPEADSLPKTATELDAVAGKK
ncbi:hypothetical protein FGG08_004767 [Glutinoglossum americanum]|uniref:Uncharacterized protein n=1 Tax=Glutinoglossum americanum TaxID=1670608 RepID=A0A9P8IAP4_9PEZI|nr:hypothetical protein FGG08_004767 [Glutinoglossum americanum]